MSDAREQRLAVDMGSEHGGALREAAWDRAEKGKALVGDTNCSKKQQAALAGDALACAAAYDDKELRARGGGSGAWKRKEIRASFDETRNGIITAKVDTLVETKERGAVQARKPAPARPALAMLAPDLGEANSKVTAAYGNSFMNKET
eukprot:6082518-Pleurochrysis_carterae.AAC.2